MSNSEDLQYSSEASATRYIYFKDLNDINIFVEDKDKEYEYETIFNRMFQNKYHITTIFGLGGKQSVKEKFNEFGTRNVENPQIKNFYIVDGDFDRYIGEKMIDNPNFIYLKTYNIENYFLDEEACLQFIKGRLKCLDYFVKSKINFQYWMKTIINQASKLFFCYSFIKKYYPENKTLERSPYEFIDMKTGFERKDDSYKNYYKYVLSLDSDAEKQINKIIDIYININGNEYFNLICGKFLLTSLCCYLRSIINEKFNYNDFKWHLINHFDVSKLDYIKNSILQNIGK